MFNFMIIRKCILHRLDGSINPTKMITRILNAEMNIVLTKLSNINYDDKNK